MRGWTNFSKKLARQAMGKARRRWFAISVTVAVIAIVGTYLTGKQVYDRTEPYANPDSLLTHQGMLADFNRRLNAEFSNSEIQVVDKCILALFDLSRREILSGNLTPQDLNTLRNASGKVLDASWKDIKGNLSGTTIEVLPVKNDCTAVFPLLRSGESAYLKAMYNPIVLDTLCSIRDRIPLHANTHFENFKEFFTTFHKQYFNRRASINPGRVSIAIKHDDSSRKSKAWYNDVFPAQQDDYNSARQGVRVTSPPIFLPSSNMNYRKTCFLNDFSF